MGWRNVFEAAVAHGPSAFRYEVIEPLMMKLVPGYADRPLPGLTEDGSLTAMRGAPYVNPKDARRAEKNPFAMDYKR